MKNMLSMHNKDQINRETIIKRSESLLSNDLGNDVVMMDIEQGAYYGLEEVAARIWKLTETPVSVNSMCEKLTAEYDVPENKCLEEVMDFISDLLSRNIVQIVEQ